MIELIIIIMFAIVLLLVGVSWYCALYVIIECFKYFKRQLVIKRQRNK